MSSVRRSSRHCLENFRYGTAPWFFWRGVPAFVVRSWLDRRPEDTLRDVLDCVLKPFAGWDSPDPATVRQGPLEPRVQIFIILAFYMKY
jgi:hypothetical protein